MVSFSTSDLERLEMDELVKSLRCDLDKSREQEKATSRELNRVRDMLTIPEDEACHLLQLESKVKTLTRKLTEIEFEKEKSGKESNGLVEELTRKLEQTIDNDVKQITHLQQRLSDNAIVEEKFEGLKLTLQASSERVTSDGKTIINLQKQLDEAEKTILEDENLIIEQEQLLSDNDTRIIALQGESVAQKKEIFDLRAELVQWGERTKTEQLSKMSEEGKHCILKKELQEMRTNLSEREIMFQTCSTENSLHKKEINELRLEISQHQERMEIEEYSKLSEDEEKQKNILKQAIEESRTSLSEREIFFQKSSTEHALQSQIQGKDSEKKISEGVEAHIEALWGIRKAFFRQNEEEGTSHDVVELDTIIEGIEVFVSISSSCGQQLQGVKLAYDHLSFDYNRAQKEFDESILAMQRVLADISSSNEEEVIILKSDVKTLNNENTALNDENSVLNNENDLLNDANRKLKKRICQMNDPITIVTDEMSSASSSSSISSIETQNKSRDGELEILSSAVGFDEMKVKSLRYEVSKLKEEQRQLRIELKSKNEALCCTQKTITSLESANKEFAANIKSKLRDKESELWSIKIDSAVNSRSTESLKEKLESLEIIQEEERFKFRRVKNQLEKEKTAHLKQVKKLKQRLEKRMKTTVCCLAEQVSFSVKESLYLCCEAGNKNIDSSNSDDAISGFLERMSTSLNHTLTICGKAHDDVDDSSTVQTEATSVEKKLYDIQESEVNATMELMTELDEGNSTIMVLMESSATQRAELEELKLEYELCKKCKETELIVHRSEVEHLQKQRVNFLVSIAEKDRQLTLLNQRSWQIGEDTNIDDIVSLADGEIRNVSDMSEEAYVMEAHKGENILNSLEQKLATTVTEKETITKHLEEQIENLSNAKLIISSLEKANKDMFEDLKSKLRGSTEIIKELEERDHVWELTADKLRKELDSSLNKKVNEDLEHGARSLKLRDEALNCASRLAAREMTIQMLETRISKLIQSDSTEPHAEMLYSTSLSTGLV